MSQWEYDGEDECTDCDKLCEVNDQGICKKCHGNQECESCLESNDDCQCKDDRGDGDFNERGGYSRSYINWINNGF